MSGDQEPIGSAELSLLPLFKTGHLDASIDLKHITEVRRIYTVLGERRFMQKTSAKYSIQFFVYIARRDIGGWESSFYFDV